MKKLFSRKRMGKAIASKVTTAPSNLTKDQIKQLILSRAYFQLSPELKRELKAKWAFTLVVEALALIGLIALTGVTVALTGALL